MKRWGGLLLSVLLSAMIWLVYNLSQNYSEIVSIPVVAESNIEGRARRSSTEVTVSAMVNAPGFHLLSLAAGHSKPVSVEFSPEDLKHTEGDIFEAGVSNLIKYVSQIFGDDVSLESFISGDLQFRFPVENHKKVPVKPVQIISFKSQYMALEDMKVIPDSVVVYGDPARLAGIDAVFTKPVSKKDLRSSIHGTARLQVPSGVRLSQRDVLYSLEVSRYVEVSTTSRVVTRHAPAGKRLTILPSSVDVSFRCVFPMNVNPIDRSEFYVDYREFSESITGRCVVHCDGLPEGVISYAVNPEICECTE